MYTCIAFQWFVFYSQSKRFPLSVTDYLGRWQRDRLHFRRQRDSRRMDRQSQYKKSGLSTYSLRNKREEKRNDTKQQRNDLIMRRRGNMPLAEIQEVPLDKTSTYKIRVFYLNYTIILFTPQGLVNSLMIEKHNWNSGRR